MTHARNLSHAINEVETWLKEMETKSAIESPNDAWAATRAVVQTLRDRLSVEEAAHLSAQLPLILRGVFYEGWNPTEMPKKYGQDEFLEQVRKRLNGACADVDALTLTEYVFAVINHHVDPGQVDHVKTMLPKDLQSLWPVQLAA